jgi:hypothetical protein
MESRVKRILLPSQMSCVESGLNIGSDAPRLISWMYVWDILRFERISETALWRWCVSMYSQSALSVDKTLETGYYQCLLDLCMSFGPLRVCNLRQLVSKLTRTYHQQLESPLEHSLADPIRVLFRGWGCRPFIVGSLRLFLHLFDRSMILLSMGAAFRS